jgi:hypothetical protein
MVMRLIVSVFVRFRRRGNNIRTVGNLYAHVPGLIVLSAGTHEDAEICCMPLFKVQTL